MKQILLITDGGSNVGDSPVIAAAQAYAEGITVNVAGVIDEGTIGEYGAAEIAEIARAGGGISRIVTSRQLSRTVQMMTRQTVAGTIRNAVNQELRELFGVNDVGALPPPKRAEIVKVMEEMEETMSLSVALLIDASASMKPKLLAVEEAVRDLTLSIQARTGRSQVSVFHFPGDTQHDYCVKDAGWTSDASKIGSLFGRIRMKGTTPTGPALLQVVDFIRATCGKISKTELTETPIQGTRGESNGVRSDYVV
ncbi:VWA domain-containing protein [Cohnella endophytica]|uniref:VWA domain-containing protein n=1 Tax=Cohnella endophytica TaxID=2419778 RepID=A0A494X464_9BACL|nr:vWA domain-containing protein [Cohnella endophytica]RKP45477.1 VWA domain-containing protein [Cohnella endophytica]